MNNNTFLVSAIVSTYNSEKFIREKIEDLLEQTLKERLEIIIVNSGSMQNEDAIIKEYLTSNSNIKYIRTEERESIYKAWNRGIKIASGEFITNSNTDDRLRNDAYQVLSDILIKNPEIALVYADQYITNVPNQKFNEVTISDINIAPDFDRLHQFERCLIGSQPMWRASLHFKDDIWFNERYEVCGDHEFEMNISQKYELFHYSEILGTYYKCSKRSNKEYEDPQRTKAEVFEATLIYLYKYFDTMEDDKLKKYRMTLEKWVRSPFYLSGLMKKIQKKLFPSGYTQSLQFIFLMVALIYEKENRVDKAIEVCERFLRYRSSVRIQHYLEFLQEGNSIKKLAVK